MNVEIRGSNFFFSNGSTTNSQPGYGDGYAGGSADFINGTFDLTTEPYETGVGLAYAGGGPTTPLFIANVEAGNISGTYGAIPEPANAGLIIASLLGGAVWRWRRNVRAGSLQAAGQWCNAE